MGPGRQELGRWGEAQAARHLESRGCQVVASRWRCPAGEVDIVVLDGECLAFVEVRTRSGHQYGTPEESITQHKLTRMAAVAEAYVYEQGWEGHWRLDVVAVQVDGRRITSVEWYRNVSA